jgi:hypothetical protein
MKRTLIATLALIGLIGLASGVATAHKKKFKTAVEMRLEATGQGDSFRGTIKAGDRCIAGRTVMVFRHNPGGEPQLIGQTKTDTSGAFVVALQNFAAPGNYQAVVSKTTTKKGSKHRHKCLEGTSNLVAVGDGPPSPPPPPPPYY